MDLDSFVYSGISSSRDPQRTLLGFLGTSLEFITNSMVKLITKVLMKSLQILDKLMQAYASMSIDDRTIVVATP